MNTLRDKTAEEIAQEALSCIVDSANGIYVGKRLGEIFAESLDSETREILADTDHEYYCDTWTDVADNHEIEKDGKVYNLYTSDNGDVFLVDLSVIWAWEYVTGLDFWDEYLGT